MTPCMSTTCSAYARFEFLHCEYIRNDKGYKKTPNDSLFEISERIKAHSF